MRLCSRLAHLAFWTACMLCRSPGVDAADYTTFHFDNARDGWNPEEVLLSKANAARITKIGDYQLDGEVDAQPLYLHREYIASRRSRRSVAYVATENDTMYAIEPGGGILWRRSFGTAVRAKGLGRCAATAPTIGIEGTPVIDTRTDTMYFASYAVVAGSPTYVLHAISPGNGADKRAVDISALVGNVSAERQRVGLLEANGNIYLAFGGSCDFHPEATDGRILAFDAATLALRFRFITTSSNRCRSFRLGTIWALGFAPAADSSGNVYVATGNGCIDYSRVAGGAYADAVLRLTPQLKLVSTATSLFAPCDALRENARDQEIGSAGVLLVPNSTFLIAGGKTGVTYVLERERLGGYRGTCPDRVVSEAQTNWGIWGGPIAWASSGRDYLAIAGTGPGGMRTYALDRRSGALTPVSKTGIRLYNGGQSGVVTSDGSAKPASFVLWMLTRPTTGTIELQAYDPRNLSRPLVSVPAGSWGNPGGYAGVSPTVVDGLIFVGSNRRLTIWSAARKTALSSRSSVPTELWVYPIGSHMPTDPVRQRDYLQPVSD